MIYCQSTQFLKKKYITYYNSAHKSIINLNKLGNEKIFEWTQIWTKKKYISFIYLKSTY